MCDNPVKEMVTPLLTGQRKPLAIDMYVALRLKSLRTFNNMSQEQLSHKLGVTFQQVQKYENGTNRISAGRLYAIGCIFSVPVNYFFDGYEDYVKQNF